jgi:MAF protein
MSRSDETGPSIILASASPRRGELLRQVGVRFRVVVTDVDESVRPGEAPGEYVLRVARDKALEAQRREHAALPVLAADTAVVLDGCILGKPGSRAEAADMLSRLAGRTHEVYSGVALARGAGAVDERLNVSRVTFAPLDQAWIEAYIGTGDPLDKAGAYGVQGRAAEKIAASRAVSPASWACRCSKPATYCAAPKCYPDFSTSHGPSRVSEEILINSTPSETRVALVENGMLQEVWLERASHTGYIGNIYKGVVSRVLPGLQAAFIDIGLERTAFLHARDMVRNDPVTTGDVTPPEPLISNLLRPGDRLIVQVIKDPLGSKGARLTTNISVPSRFLVLLPDCDVVGVSARIEEEAERARLKALVHTLRDRGLGHGYIVRTNAEGVNDFALSADMVYLGKVWQAINERIATAAPATCVFEDLSLPLRALRDLMHEEVDRVRIDSEGGACRRRVNSPAASSPTGSSGSRSTAATGRSSTCSAWKTRSTAPCVQPCRSNPAATSCSSRPRR